MIDARVGQFAFHADGFDRHADDYDTPEGRMSNSYFRGDGYAGGGSYFFGDSRIGAGAIHYDAKYGIPGEDTFIDMKQTKELMRSSFAVGAGVFQTLNVEGGYADYEHSERDPATNEALSTFKDHEWDGRAEGLFGEMGPFSGAAVRRAGAEPRLLRARRRRRLPAADNDRHLRRIPVCRCAAGQAQWTCRQARASNR